jgi:hypothetical protein
VVRTSSKYALSPGLEEAELLADESDELLELYENEQPIGPSRTASTSRRPTGCQRRRTK